MKIRAYAKVNLTLDVTGRREDGLHTLDTVMQSVSLWDEIELTPGGLPGIRVQCSRDYIPVDNGNTAYRAAQYFFRKTGLRDEGLSIVIHKRIPSRAGMGGGSTDAAAVLRALNSIYGANLPMEALRELATRVGADVPFCLQGGTCRCTGIGEILEPVTELPNCFFVICKPPAGMSTLRAYALLDQYPMSRKYGTPRMVEALEKGGLPKIAQCLQNRFEETLRLVQVRDIKKALLGAGAMGAVMTGSGSAVYGIFDTEAAARNAAQLLTDKGKVYVTRPLRSGEIR